jgi:hypothetical protein
MSICRFNVSVGVLDGVMYAIGGNNGSISLKSVEAYKPSAGWYSIADMHFCRENPGDYKIINFLENLQKLIHFLSFFYYRSSGVGWFIVRYWWNVQICCFEFR